MEECFSHNVKCKKNNKHIHCVYNYIKTLYAYRQNPGIED